MAELKKKWIKIIAPKLLNGAEVGETPYLEAEKLIGKGVEVNIGFSIGDIKRQHMKLKLKIKEIKNDLANTEIVGYEAVKSHIKRVVRKDRSKIEDSFIVECTDKIKVRIKPFISTRYKTKRSVLTNLRKAVQDFCNNYAKKVDYEELIKNTISNNLQKEIKNACKKIFPLAFCEIKELKRI